MHAPGLIAIGRYGGGITPTPVASHHNKSTSWQSERIECTGCRGTVRATRQVLPGGLVLKPSLRMSEYEEHSSLCWKPARATFVIPPGRSDHEPCRPTGKAYGGPVSSFKATGASDVLAETCHSPSGRLSPRTRGPQQPFKGIGRQQAHTAYTCRDRS